MLPRLSALVASDTSVATLTVGSTPVTFGGLYSTVHSTGGGVTLSPDGTTITLVSPGTFVVRYQVTLTGGAVALVVHQDGEPVPGSGLVHTSTSSSTMTGSQLVTSAGGSRVQVHAVVTAPRTAQAFGGPLQIIVTQVGFRQLSTISGT